MAHLLTVFHCATLSNLLLLNIQTRPTATKHFTIWCVRLHRPVIILSWQLIQGFIFSIWRRNVGG